MSLCPKGVTLTLRWPMLACVLGLTGCTALLPRSEEMTRSPWQSYQEAQSAFDKIIPGQTTLAELKALKLDPGSNPNITILNYSDVLRRFLLNPSLTTRDLDRAVQQCIGAKTACIGYEVNKRVVKKHRNGSFFADFLNFRRTTHIEGWKFNGLVLIKENVVVYKLTGGQPAIAEYEENHNPLGPLQGVGGRLLGVIGLN